MAKVWVCPFNSNSTPMTLHDDKECPQLARAHSIRQVDEAAYPGAWSKDCSRCRS